MASNTLLYLYLCSISYAYVKATTNSTEYNFVLHTINQYTPANIPSQSDLEYYIGTSFISTLSQAFKHDRNEFELDIDRLNTTNEYYSFYVAPYIQKRSDNMTDTEILILFESYIDMQHIHFEQYIFYNFFQTYLSQELLKTHNLTLVNLTWLEMTDVPLLCDNDVPTDNIVNNEWEMVTNALFKDIYDFLRWIFIAILGLSCIVIISGYAHSWLVMNYDICIGNGIFFCFAMFDWYSDILFTFTIPVQHIYLWFISFCLLLFPLIGNVAWLISSQKLWEQDAAIGARAKAWLLRWRPFLYSLTIITGSSFGAINLCNSNMFGYPLFRMGLRRIHLERFDMKRLFISVCGENAPQLLLQGYYWFVLDSSTTNELLLNENKLALGLAMISGIISILYAFGVIYSSQITLSKFNDTECELFEFNILSPKDFPFRDHRSNQGYKYKMYPLRKAFASMLQTELSYVELHPPIKIEHGYQLRFTLQVTQLGGNTVAFKVLRQLIEYDLVSAKIAQVWALDNLPSITELKWKKDRKRDYHSNMVLVHVDSKSRSNFKKSMENITEVSMSHTQTFSKPHRNRHYHEFEVAALKKGSNVHSPSQIPSYSNPVSSPSPNPQNQHTYDDTTVIHNVNNPLFGMHKCEEKEMIEEAEQSHSHSMNSAMEMIANPSNQKNHSSKKDVFTVYDFNDSNGILIDDDDQYAIQQSIVNDGILLEQPCQTGNNDLREQAMSMLSTVGSEALFQQQLFNHIKQQNTFSTLK